MTAAIFLDFEANYTNYIGNNLFFAMPIGIAYVEVLLDALA